MTQPGLARACFLSAPPKIERRPKHRAVNQASEPEMRGQTVLTDAWVVDQPAFHHVPAQRALQAAEQENEGQARHQAAINFASRSKINQRQQENDTYQPP